MVEDVSLTKRSLVMNEGYYNDYMLNEEGTNKLRWKKEDDKNFYVP
jgi:hypothetical protein